MLRGAYFLLLIRHSNLFRQLHIILIEEVDKMAEKRYQYKDCSAVLGTLTLAQKAQRALASAAIPSSVIKSDASSLHRGCVWSVNFSCNQKENVRTVLSAANVKVKAWSDGDDIFR